MRQLCTFMTFGSFAPTHINTYLNLPVQKMIDGRSRSLQPAAVLLLLE